MWDLGGPITLPSANRSSSLLEGLGPDAWDTWANRYLDL